MSVQRRPKKGKPKGGGKPRWLVRYRDPSGRERAKSFTYAEYAQPEKAAKAYDEEQSRLLRRREWVDDSNAPTLAELWPLWEAAATSPGTKAVRVTVGKNLGDLATTKITELRPSQLRTWRALLREGRPWKPGCDGLAKNTRTSWWNQVSGCLNMAVDDGLMLTNPCSRVRASEDTEPVDPRTLPTIEQIRQAVTHADKTGRDTLATMILVGVSTGLRPSEVAGLHWHHIDRGARVLSVEKRTRAVSKGKTDLGPLKNTSARRTVPVPPRVMSRLLEHRLRHPARDDQPIFTRPSGGMWSSDDIASSMRALTDKQWTFHALRHVYASSLIRQGRGVKAVQKMLGHKNASTTLDTYTHMWPDEDDLVRDAADDLMRAVCGQSAESASDGDAKSGRRSV